MNDTIRRRAVALVAAALLSAGLAFAQEAEPQAADAAAFDAAAFDAAAGSTPGRQPGSASAAKTEYLVGGSVLVSASAFAPSGLDGYAASASAAGELFGKVSVPDYGSLFMSYNLSQALFEGLYGTGAPAFAPPLDLASPGYALGELYYSFDLGKLLFVRLGKQLLAWGPSRLWTPVDFINRQRADFFSSIDLRPGTPGLKLLLPLGKANATLFADFSRLVSSGVVDDPISATRLAGRLDAALGGFELAITGFGGENAQAKAGFDFSGDLLGNAVYGEFAFAPSYSSYSDSYSASIGFSRAVGDLKHWTISGEAFYNSAGADHTGDAFAMSTLSPLYIGEAYGYASVAAKELLSPDLATSVSALANFSDLSYILRLSEDFSFPRSVPFTLTLAFSGGGAGKEFTLIGGDNSFFLSAKTRIEF